MHTCIQGGVKAVGGLLGCGMPVGPGRGTITLRGKAIFGRTAVDLAPVTVVGAPRRVEGL